MNSSLLIFNPLPIICIIIFSVNNFYLKSEYSNWLTGKLSDLTFCFFCPLWLYSVVLFLKPQFTEKQKNITISLSTLFTAILFTLMKTNINFSQFHDLIQLKIWENLGVSPHKNILDISDLLALLSCIGAFYYGKSKIQKSH